MQENTIIKVTDVSKTFRLPHEKTTSLKSSVINFYRRDKGYEKQQALKNVSFEIFDGDFFGIVGRNGSGKSTLLKLLAGIYIPDKGEIIVNGKLTPFIELGVGFNPELTGRENVYLNGALLGFSRKEMRSMYQEIVDFAEIERFMDQKLKNYSSGMQVRLAFSISIRAKSDILLLDEVLAVGDSAFQQKCYNYFEELKRNKKTVVFVSHDMGAIRRFCNRAVFLENGKITNSGNPLDIADVYQEVNMKRVNEQTMGVDAHQENIKVTVLEQTEDNLRFAIDYTNKKKIKAFVGFSIIKDGLTVAELNSLGSESSKEKGHLEYNLNLKVFNKGLYQISAALIAVKNTQVIEITKKRAMFNIMGHDNRRGGAIYLDVENLSIR